MKKPEIIFQDEDILVCAKPARVATQTSRVSEPDLVSILKNELYKQDRTKEPYLAVIHRLDQPVSGLLVFAKTKAAAADLSGQLQRDSFSKDYLALVSKMPEKKEDTLVDWLLKDGRTNISCVVPEGTADAKRAELAYEVMDERFVKELTKTAGQMAGGRKSIAIPEGTALIQVHLKTGRHHQIRVQMSHAGYPLVGDAKYNQETAGGRLNRDTEKTSESARSERRRSIGSRPGQIALCAYHLKFRHPKTKKNMEFTICPEFLW